VVQVLLPPFVRSPSSPPPYSVLCNTHCITPL
jgi:hypothetical protein